MNVPIEDYKAAIDNNECAYKRLSKLLLTTMKVPIEDYKAFIDYNDCPYRRLYSYY